MCFIIGTLLYSFIEIIGRHSVSEFFDFFVNDFFVFVYNDLIVVATLAFSLFVRRRMFAVSLISAGWLTLGVTNCVLLIFRITPLNVSDFRIIFDAVGMLGVYLKPLHFVLIFIGFTLLGIILALIWRKSEKFPTQLVRAFGSVSAVSLTLALFTVIGINSSALAENFDDFEDLSEAYDDSGFVYGFAKTVMDRGIEQPETYSEATMASLCGKLSDAAGDIVQSDVNIIFLQLESAFDVSRLWGLEVSEDPMPNYTALKNSHSSGLLTVPTIGSGTANMEFEVLTGMMLDCFGAGEYPYYTILTEKSCESMAYIARAAGMKAHAFHNYDGAFYGRNVVLDNLGFNTYTSIEYMKDLEYNALGWADDMVLKDAITDALDSTEGFDFVFATTITSHGAYPSDIEPDGDITVDYGDDPELTAKFEYYVNELRKVDNFIGALINELEERGEKTLVVIYGDHLPSLELDDRQFISGDSHTTEYVIWDNFGLPVSEIDLCSYQLGAAVTSRLNLTGGVVNTLNSLMLEADSVYGLSRFGAMSLVQYDMLYGEAYCDGYTDIERVSDFKMSIYPLIAESAVYSENEDDKDTLTVTGHGFTEFSRVMVDGNEQETVYIDENTLCVPDIILFDLGCEVAVGQFNENGQLLSASDSCEIIVQ